MLNTCPGCLWVGAPTNMATVYECTTYHCRVGTYFTLAPAVLVA